MRILLWFSFACTLLVMACCTVPTNPAPEPVSAGEAQPHDLAQSKGPALCTKCHQANPGGFALDSTAMCTQCHGEDVSHMVGVEVDFSIPKDLPLSEDGTVTCLTCHRAHGPLRSDRPWANVTVIDRWLNTEAMRKTYLLRRNNENGELCLVCHATTKE